VLWQTKSKVIKQQRTSFVTTYCWPMCEEASYPGRRSRCLWSGTAPRRCATSAGTATAEGEGCEGRRPPAGCRSSPREPTTLSSWAQRWGSLIPASGRRSHRQPRKTKQQESERRRNREGCCLQTGIVSSVELLFVREGQCASMNSLNYKALVTLGPQTGLCQRRRCQAI